MNEDRAWYREITAVAALKYAETIDPVTCLICGEPFGDTTTANCTLMKTNDTINGVIVAFRCPRHSDEQFRASLRGCLAEAIEEPLRRLDK